MKSTMRVLAVAASTAAILGTGMSAQAAPTATSSTAGTSVAQSSTAAWACPKKSLCVWTGKNGTGLRAVFKNGDVDLSKAPGPSGMNDRIRSVRNRTGSTWSFHTGTHYNGTTKYVYAYQRGNLVKAMDRKVSSIKRR